MKIPGCNAAPREFLGKTRNGQGDFPSHLREKSVAIILAFTKN